MAEQSEPGSSWHNPIWYGRYRIYVSDCPYERRFEYIHEDYDGAEDSNDNRAGSAKTVAECKAEIDEYEDERSSELPAAIGLFLCIAAAYAWDWILFGGPNVV